jgi:peptidyl-prolyl cis-trans isomerase SurA
MNKAKKMFVLILFVLCGVVLTGQEVVEEIVAIVNDDVITLSQYKQEYEMRVQELRAQAARAQAKAEDLDKALEQLKTGLMDALITDLLVLQLAREKNLNVAEEVKRYVESLKKDNNLASDEDLKRALASQGMDYAQFLKQAEEGILKQAVVSMEIDRSIVLDDSEVVNYYKLHPQDFVDPEEYKISAIYLSPEGKSAEELEQKKTEISGKVRAGEDFNTLSQTYSDGPIKESKGELGTFKKGELDKTLEQAVSQLKQGEVSAWLETKNGWYLLKLTEKKDSRRKTFEEAKPAIEQRIFAEKRNAKTSEFLDNLKKRSFIKILKPNPLGVKP